MLLDEVEALRPARAKPEIFECQENRLKNRSFTGKKPREYFLAPPNISKSKLKKAQASRVKGYLTMVSNMLRCCWEDCDEAMAAMGIADRGWFSEYMDGARCEIFGFIPSEQSWRSWLSQAEGADGLSLAEVCCLVYAETGGSVLIIGQQVRLRSVWSLQVCSGVFEACQAPGFEPVIWFLV